MRKMGWKCLLVALSLLVKSEIELGSMELSLPTDFV